MTKPTPDTSTEIVISEDAIVLFRRLDAMVDREGDWVYGERKAIEAIQKVLDNCFMRGAEAREK